MADGELATARSQMTQLPPSFSKVCEVDASDLCKEDDGDLRKADDSELATARSQVIQLHPGSARLKRRTSVTLQGG